MNTDLNLYTSSSKIAEKREEEEEEDALPLDMMDEDDLKLMEDLAQKASFLTRDLSSK